MRLYRELLMNRTPGERMRMTASMHDEEMDRIVEGLQKHPQNQ
jgi:hypothetical protein